MVSYRKMVYAVKSENVFRRNERENESNFIECVFIKKKSANMYHLFHLFYKTITFCNLK